MDDPKIIFVHHGSGTPTKQVLELESALKERGINVIEDRYDGYKNVDLSLPRAKIDIEVDGIHHLTNPKQILADLNRGYYSHKDGFSTMHIPNEMIRLHLEHIANGLAEAAKARERKIKIHTAS